MSIEEQSSHELTTRNIHEMSVSYFFLAFAYGGWLPSPLPWHVIFSLTMFDQRTHLLAEFARDCKWSGSHEAFSVTEGILTLTCMLTPDEN